MMYVPIKYLKIPFTWDLSIGMPYVWVVLGKDPLVKVPHVTMWLVGALKKIVIPIVFEQDVQSQAWMYGIPHRVWHNRLIKAVWTFDSSL